VLGPYLLFMTSTAFYSLLLRLGFATKRFKAMTTVQIVQNVLDMLLMFLLIQGNVGLRSLSLANGISYLLSLIIILVIVKDLYNPFTDKVLFKEVGKIILANIPILVGVILYKLLAPPWYTDGSTWKNLGILIVIGLSSIFVWLASYKRFKIDFFTILSR